MSSVRRQFGPLTLDIPALIIGVQILLKAWEKVEAGHHPILAPVLFFLGGTVVVGAFLTLWIEKRTESSHALFHIAEGVAIMLSAAALFESGRLRIPIVLFFTGLCYLVAGLVETQPAARRARLARPLQQSFGWTFVVAGTVLAASAAFNDRSVGAFTVAGLWAAVGFALLLMPRSWFPARPGDLGETESERG